MEGVILVITSALEEYDKIFKADEMTKLSKSISSPQLEAR